MRSARMAGLKGLEGMLTKAASSSGLQVNYLKCLLRYKSNVSTSYLIASTYGPGVHFFPTNFHPSL